MDAAARDFETLELELAGPVGRLTLRRPQRLNALSPAALQELVDAAAAIGADEHVKVVVVGGAGRAFSAGFDLDAAAGAPDADMIDLGRRMAEAVQGVPAITIAAIHGHCVGGGIVLAAACDLRVAAASARFSIPEVDFGIPLAWGGIPRLVRELGPAVTKELVLTCRPFDAAEARALGILNRVVADDELAAAVDALAAELARKPALLLRATKRRVDELVAAAYPTGAPGQDAELTLEALSDDACRATALAYLQARGRD